MQRVDHWLHDKHHEYSSSQITSFTGAVFVISIILLMGDLTRLPVLLCLAGVASHLHSS